MAKVVFIYPGYENLGIEALSAALKKAGHIVRLILDPIMFSESGSVSSEYLGKIFSFRKQMLSEVWGFNPDLICFSVISDNYRWASSFASEIKAKKNIPIVFGGIHPTSVPELVIKEEFVDYVCIGEGDQAIVELADNLSCADSTLEIRNIWAKSGTEIIRNPVRPLIEDLDKLPFCDKDLFYSNALIFDYGYLISTSRGCPYQCNFCCNSVLKKVYSQTAIGLLRRRSVNHVICELKIARQIYGATFIAFVDDTFNFDLNWIKEFLVAYKQKIGLPFSCYLSPSNISEGLVCLLKECGCFKVQTGVQSINNETRCNLLGRVYSNEQIAEFINLFRKYSIYLVCDNIFGLPGQSEEELLQLAEFYNKNMPSLIEMFWLRYYPGTVITEKARQDGLISQDKYQDIINGRISLGIAKGGDHYIRSRSKIQLMLNFFHFFSEKVRTWFIGGGYRILPVVSPVRQLVIIRLLLSLFGKGPIFDMYKKRTIRRYNYFFWRKLKIIFNMEKISRVWNKFKLIYRLGISRMTFPKACLMFRYIIKTKIFKQDCPGAVIIGLTYSCQCKCVHCSIGGYKVEQRKELKTDEVKGLIDQIVKMGTPKINFFGGEPLLSKHIFEYIKYASKKGISVSVDTNGYLLDSDCIKKLKQAGVNNVNISLDSAHEKIHDKLRRTQGLYPKVINAISECVREKVICVVSTYASHRSIKSGDLDKIILLAKAKGATAVKILFPMLSGQWMDRQDMLLSNEEKQYVFSLLDPGYVYLESPLFSMKKGAKVCEALRKKMVYVSPYGDVQACYAVPFMFGNIAKKPFAEIVALMWSKDIFNTVSCEDCAINHPVIHRKIFNITAGKEMPLPLAYENKS